MFDRIQTNMSQEEFQRSIQEFAAKEGYKVGKQTDKNGDITITLIPVGLKRFSLWFQRKKILFGVRIRKLRRRIFY